MGYNNIANPLHPLSPLNASNPTYYNSSNMDVITYTEVTPKKVEKKEVPNTAVVFLVTLAFGIAFLWLMINS
jgi:hypothetical protein